MKNNALGLGFRSIKGISIFFIDAESYLTLQKRNANEKMTEKRNSKWNWNAETKDILCTGVHDVTFISLHQCQVENEAVFFTWKGSEKRITHLQNGFFSLTQFNLLRYSLFPLCRPFEIQIITVHYFFHN